MTSEKTEKADATPAGSLGTFGGVFLPSVLTILGIILFMRLGYVTGNAGLGKILIILGIANVISITTSFSLSAIATNLRVKGGGDYYVISRTLGAEFGGAIGIVLFLAQSISIAFYCIGLGEVLGSLMQEGSIFSPQLIAVCAVLFLFIFAWLGADWATRFQYVVLALLVLALASFFAGGLLKWDPTLLKQNWHAPSDTQPFWAIFAIFFPAVTGFTQGVSMSGDLKDPAKSLPMGTFLAVGVSIVVYLAAAVVFAATLPNDVLVTNYSAMNQVAVFSPLIDAGVIAATLSSAMASFMGAPRILQSMAGDRIFEFLVPFAKGVGPTNNPRRGVLLACCIALSIIALGNLNLVASIVSMFFLLSYALLNYATYYEAKGKSPSFRPEFRYYHPVLSLVGGLSCLFIILAIDFKSGLVAFSVLFAIYQYLRRTVDVSRWADSRRSNYLQRIRQSLIAINDIPEHPRDWRPNILVFSDEKERRKSLLKLASWINGKSGIATAVQILQEDGNGMYKKKKMKEAELKADVKGQSAFSLVVADSDLTKGFKAVIQSFGIGVVKANTVLMNWFEGNLTVFDRWREDRLNEILKSTFRFGCNLILFAERDLEKLKTQKTKKNQLQIIIWWSKDTTGHLMLLLAYLMTRHTDWAGVRISLLAINYDAVTPENLEEIHQILENARIDAKYDIVPGATVDKMVEVSADADLVFCPLYLSKKRLTGPFGADIDDLMLRVTSNLVLVKAAQDVDLDAEPEEGATAVIATLKDDLRASQKRHVAAEKEYKEAVSTEKEARTKVDKRRGQTEIGPDDELMALAEKNLELAERLLKKAERKLAKESAKVKIAKEEAQKVGVTIGNDEEDL